jgi:death on curing protein
MTGGFVYPSVEEVYDAHDAIIDADPEADSGVVQEGKVDFTIHYISEGFYGKMPETVHEKAAQLMRLIAANHEFADGNKRTALAATAAFYFENGYYFDYEDEEIRTLLKTFAVIERVVDMDEVAVYFGENTIPLEEIEDEDIQRALSRLTK